jgi:hypothetical protein
MDIKQIQDGMQKCSAETEKIYTRLGNCFPSLLSIQGADSSNLPALESVFRNLSGGFSMGGDGGSGFFERYNTKNTELVRDLNEKMSALSGNNERVSAIRTDSEELEIISLNAMVISIKSGEKGRAFSCITENLKRLSARMISLSNELILDERKLVDRNEALKASFSAVIAAQNNVLGAHTVNNEDISPAIAKASQSLKSMMDEAGMVSAPIRESMAGIQLQDIVRQSIDQIILVLREIKDITATGTVEERLDKLTFDAELLDLCIRIAKDVHDHLDKSLAIFTENWKGVHEILDTVERLRLSFISEYLDSRNRSGSSIPVILDGMTNGFSSYVSQIGIYQRGQQTMVRDSALIVSEVKHLRVIFDTIKPIIARLQHVRITQQIEVAKNPAISAVKDTVDHMSELIMQADLRVQETRTELEDFIAGIEGLTESYSASSSEDQRELERIKQEKMQFFNDMKRYQEELASLVAHFQVYPDSFQSMCAEIDGMLSELKDVVRSVEGISVHLDSFLRECSSVRIRLLNENGISDWQIHNDRFRELVKRFTITAHKEAAGKIGGFDVEDDGLDAIQSGDVTLFF